MKKELRLQTLTMLDQIKSEESSVVVVLMNKSVDKVHIVSGVSKDLVKKGLDAGKIVKEVAPLIGGSGGGKAEMAQAGGKNTENIEEALKRANEIILNQLKNRKES